MNYRNLTKAQAGSVNAGLRAYMIGVFNKMFLGLLLTGIIAWQIGSNPGALAYMARGPMMVCTIAELAIAIFLPMRLHKMQTSTAELLFFAYSGLMGASLAPIFLIYTGESIASAFFSAAGFFGGMSLLGYTTKRDLTELSSFLFVGLISILLVSLVNAFVRSEAISLGLSSLSVLLFAGLVSYDVQRIKVFYSQAPNNEALSKLAIFGSFSLYLDFINIFISVLRLLGNRK